MSGWDISPTAFIKVSEDMLAERQQTIAADALQLIVTASPVADGAYKSNHRVTINGNDFGFNADDLTLQAQAKGDAVIKTIPPFSTTVIQNNAQYGNRLEHGWSGQAPDGVYRPAFTLITEKYR